MDGTYWLVSAPGLTDFYVATQCAVDGDPRPAVRDLTKGFLEKYGAPPTSQYAYPIYSWLQLWARAVTEAGTTDAKAVTAKLQSYKNAPTILGPRSFTPTLHIQTWAPMLIEEVGDGKDRVIDQWELSAPVPDDVLYRRHS